MILTILILIFILLIAYRGYRVAAYRSEFVIRVAQKFVKLPEIVDLIRSAFDELDRVTYYQMLWKFWIPMNKFLDEDNIFIKEDTK